MIFATAARTFRRFERTSAMRRNMISKKESKRPFSGIGRTSRFVCIDGRIISNIWCGLQE